MFYNYKLTWNDNHYVYVGSSNNPNKRYSQHKVSCLSTSPINSFMSSIWRKYGQPTMTIMGTFETEEEMIEGEQFLIDQIWGEPVCLNLNPIANKPPVPKGAKLSIETRAKMSASHKGKIFTEETRAKLSASHKGKVLTEEHKIKIGVSSKNRTHNEETKKIMSIIRKEKNGIMVKVKIEEQNEIVFYSVKETADYFGVCRAAIRKAINKGFFRGMKIVRFCK